MTRFALIALLLTAPLAQAETPELSCRAALAELAVAATTAESAAAEADQALAVFDDATAKLDSCRRGRNGKTGCTKAEGKLKEAERMLDLAEEELSIALEEVDAAYAEFDIACSWEEDDANVLVDLSRARLSARLAATGREPATPPQAPTTRGL